MKLQQHISPLDLLKQISKDGKSVFTIGDAQTYEPNRQRLWLALSRLEDAGWIKRLERGKYLIIPLEAGLDRIWTEDAYVIGSVLVKPCAISYWSAIRYWNWTEQMPRIVYIQTTKQRWKRDVEVLQVRYRFIKLADNKFFGISKRWLQSKEIYVTDREKTLIDALDRPDLCGGISEVIKAFLVAVKEIDWNRFNNYLSSFGSGAVYKRAGFLVETLNIDIPEKEHRLNEWRQKASKGINPLEPRGARTGTINYGWGLLLNVNTEILTSEGGMT